MRRVLVALAVVVGLACPSRGHAETRGIYLGQTTAETPARLYPLIQQSLETGVDTFVVDLWTPSKAYARAVATLQKFEIRYVPRIIVFPRGGSREQVRSRLYWQKKWQLARYALDLGADAVQLDYVRYRSSMPASPSNVADVRQVIRFFREQVHEAGSTLQVDVFGEAAHQPSLHIGQDVADLAPEVDAFCPMVYPSHYQPYAVRAKEPYETVFGSLTSLKTRAARPDLSIYAYIELSNHRHPMTVGERVEYIRAQLRAVRDAHVAGWFAWSAKNRYDLLFEILRRFGDRAAG